MNVQLTIDKAIALRDTTEGMAPADAFVMLDDYIKASVEVSQATRRILCCSLALVKQRWDEFPLEELSSWKYNFYNYAQERTGGYARGTIDNFVNVGNTWLAGDLPECIPETIQLYDKAGKPLDKVIKPDVWSQCSSKLLYATGAAKDGRLAKDPVAMGQLFNPEVGAHTLNNTIQGHTEKLPIPEKNDALKLWVEGHYIMVSKNGETDWLCELNTDPLRGQAYQCGYRYLLAALRIVE